MDQGEAKRQFKRRRAPSLVGLPLLDKCHHGRLRNALSIDADTLPKIDQMGRGKQPHFVARKLECSGQHVGHGAFAVGPCHVHKLQVLLRVAKHAAHPLRRLQIRLVSRGALPLKHGQLREQQMHCFLVGQVTQGRTEW